MYLIRDAFYLLAEAPMNSSIWEITEKEQALLWEAIFLSLLCWIVLCSLE